MPRLSENAQKVFNALPEDGEKVGGITLQRDLSISKVEYMRARDELKEQGLVISGKGRGGSLARIEGKAPEVAPSLQERAAHAREARSAKSSRRKERDSLMAKILEYLHQEGYLMVQEGDIAFSDGRPVVAIWDDARKNAKMYAIPQLEYEMLMARKVPTDG